MNLAVTTPAVLFLLPALIIVFGLRFRNWKPVAASAPSPKGACN